VFEINDVAVVTGAASGIGRAVAETLARAGAEVWIFDLNAKAAEEVAESIRSKGFQAAAHACDVTASVDVGTAVDAVLKRSGRIGILVNSAGISHVGSVETTAEEDFERLFRVNVAGTYHCMRSVIPSMKARQKGVILNLASVAASVGLSDRFAYSMTKGAVVSMTLSVAKDYVGHGIRCNCVSPGRVHTPFVDALLKTNYPGQEAEMLDKLSKTQPMGRMGTPQEIASLALYLCSDKASFVTGTDFPIDGGLIRLSTS
jgi:NAD(P)-dependent dehydrogenase (short-subunit alcohol dehydrogenase family)